MFLYQKLFMRSLVVAGKTLPQWVSWVQECFLIWKSSRLALHRLSKSIFDKIRKQFNNDNNKNNNNNNGIYWIKVILHHFQTIALFSWQDMGCTIRLKNIRTLKMKSSPVLILWKFPGPHVGGGMPTMVETIHLWLPHRRGVGESWNLSRVCGFYCF